MSRVVRAIKDPCRHHVLDLVVSTNRPRRLLQVDRYVKETNDEGGIDLGSSADKCKLHRASRAQWTLFLSIAQR